MNSPASSVLLGLRSLSASAALVSFPIWLYVRGTAAAGKSELVYEALFFLSVAILFFTANWLSSSVALSAVVRWLCESLATFGGAYRTRFWGALFFLGFLAVVFELVVGVKFTVFVASGFA